MLVILDLIMSVQKNQKVKYIHVNWGFEKIKKNNNVVSVNNFNELKKLLI